MHAFAGASTIAIYGNYCKLFDDKVFCNMCKGTLWLTLTFHYVSIPVKYLYIPCLMFASCYIKGDVAFVILVYKLLINF
jgi:integral membrane sensor domain MASE1